MVTRPFHRRLTLFLPHRSYRRHLGLVAGGLSPVFLTSFSVVTFVVPPGVDIFVSLFVDAVSAQPTMPSEITPRPMIDATMRFMFKSFV